MIRYRRPQHLSKKGATFIGSFEGFRSKPYNDPAGHATIGYGHLLHHGHVTADDRKKYPHGLTRAQALELLQRDAESASKAVRTLVKARINQAQHDALVSFAFNVGNGAFAGSTLLRLLNRWPGTPIGVVGPQAKRQVREQLARWNKAGDQVLAGLTRRRAAEARLFSTGKYS